MRTIELHSAFVWDCEECGRENFHRAVERDLESRQFHDDQNDMFVILPAAIAADISGENPDEDIDIRHIVCLAPSRVTCCHCGSRFSAEIWEEVDDDDPDRDDA